ncbi:MAG: aldehyde dehydrogenase family protein [Oscillospiraceae bacterium]
MDYPKKYGSIINGAYVYGPEANDVPDVNPANGEVLTTISGADEVIVDRAVAAAREAFPVWSGMKRAQRADTLRAMAARIEEHRDRLAELESRDTGKTFGECHTQLGFCVDMYRYFAAAIESQEGALVSHDSGSFSCVVREPLGVAGLILAWNAPSMLMSWKLAPALAAGNTVVIKPATGAAVPVLEAVMLWKDLLPAGTINVVVGGGSTVGNMLVGHPGINKISFTGSYEVGRGIGSTTGGNIVPCTLELGGKSASVIFEDANLERALQMSILGMLSSSGEVCVANSRILVQDTVYDKFLAMLKEKYEGIKVGDPMDPSVQMGPVVDARQMEKVLEYIECGKAEGAKLVCGGCRLTGPEYDKGFYIAPTIFEAENHMRIAREEIFGPVQCVMKFHTEEEALAMANDSEYGLGAAVWTKDIYRAIRFGRGLKAGTVWVNDYLDSSAGNPFGGYKKSGLGREINKMALDYYSQVKNICVSDSDFVPPIF